MLTAITLYSPNKCWQEDIVCTKRHTGLSAGNKRDHHHISETMTTSDDASKKKKDETTGKKN